MLSCVLRCYSQSPSMFPFFRRPIAFTHHCSLARSIHFWLLLSLKWMLKFSLNGISCVRLTSFPTRVSLSVFHTCFWYCCCWWWLCCFFSIKIFPVLNHVNVRSDSKMHPLYNWIVNKVLLCVLHFLRIWIRWNIFFAYLLIYSFTTKLVCGKAFEMKHAWWERTKCNKSKWAIISNTVDNSFTPRILSSRSFISLMDTSEHTHTHPTQCGVFTWYGFRNTERFKPLRARRAYATIINAIGHWNCSP